MTKEGKPIVEYFYKAGYEDGWQDCDLCDIRDRVCNKYDHFRREGEGSTDCFVPCRKWKPSIHMPKEAARLFLRVTDVRVERVQDISWEDCLGEGVKIRLDCCEPPLVCMHCTECSYAWIAFEKLWDSINAKRNGGVYSWDNNPYVWVYTIERYEKSCVDGWLVPVRQNIGTKSNINQRNPTIGDNA